MVQKPAGKGSFTSAERNRFILMVFFALVCFVAIFSGILDNLGGLPTQKAPPQGPKITGFAKIEFDQDLLAEIRDDTPIARVRIEEKPFQHLMVYAGRLVPGALIFNGLPKEPMDYDRILANPDKYRGKPVWVKARLEEDLLVTPYSLVGLVNIRGKAKDEQGRRYIFSMTQQSRRILGKGDWVKIKGFFYKLWDPDYKESKVPYIIGQQLYPSWPEWPPVTEVDPAYFHQIVDASPKDPEQSELEPFYHFLSYVKSKSGDEEFKRSAPRPDELALTRFRNDAAGSRGRPATFFVKTIYAPEICAAEENPIGEKWLTRFWAVSYRPEGLIRIIAPGRKLDIQRGQDLKVVGCFFKNLEYQAKDQTKGIVTAPVFLAVDITLHEAQAAEAPTYVKIGFIAITLAGIIALVILSIRDRRKHAAAEKAIAKKRKERLAQRLKK